MNDGVSFIMTVKNGEDFISEVIQSVQKQTIKSWEFIIVDDGSNDMTIEIIESFIAQDSRIQLIRTGGIGRGASLNLAIDKTKSKFIANIDVDDPSHPQRAEIQMEILKQNSEYALLATNSVFISDDTQPVWEMTQTGPEESTVKDITLRKEQPFLEIAINHSSVMFRKNDLITIGKYDEIRDFQFDYELWIRYSLSGYKIGLIKEKLSSKRVHKRQSFEARNRRKYLKGSFKLNLYVLKQLKLPMKYRLYIYLKYVYGFLPMSIRSKLRGLL